MLTSTYPLPEPYDPPQLRDILARQKRSEKPLLVSVDMFPIYSDDPLRKSHERLDEYLKEVGDGAWKIKPASTATGKVILETPIEQWPRHLEAILVRVLFHWTHCVTEADGRTFGCRMWRYEGGSLSGLKPLAAALLKRDPPLSEDDLVELIEARLIGGQVGSDVGEYFPLEAIVNAVAVFKARQGTPPRLAETLIKLHEWRKTFSAYGGDRKNKELTDLIVSLAYPSVPLRVHPVEHGEPWAEAVIGVLEAAANASDWKQLLIHGAEGSGSAPSGKWIKEAKKQIDKIGSDEFVRRAGEWLGLAIKPRTARLREDQIVKAWYVDYDVYSTKNEDALKGLAWSCAAANDAQLAGPLGALAEACYKKIPNVGPRSPKVGNACLIALTMLPGEGPRAELSRLKAKVKQPTARKMIDKALGKSAAAAGMSTDDLEELALGNYGLTEVGRGEQTIGDYRAVIQIEGSDAALTFIDSKGKSRTSVPAELKNDFAAPLKQLQQQFKDLSKMLSAQRDRLERMPMNRRELPHSDWRQRYVDHPLVGTLARRLIWQIGDSAGIWYDGKLVDVNGRPLKPADDALVSLWHPSAASADTVLAWRRWLEAHQITQPFKQAHREVYLLTDAERQTRTYSNRFAAHVLRQHILAALCTQRGWRYRLMGSWDGGGDTMPTIELPKWNMRVEYWLTGGGGDDGGGHGTGVAQHVFTDQVRFYRTGDAAPLPLAEVPPLAFSEMMRDVDLFVGVCSIGNDPNWHDGGDQIGDYWQHYTFGDLGISAQARRDVLERLLPRLKIAPRCTLTKRFLVVAGEIRTYKIHLGSGNILMEPNDQYLCIVADRSSKAKESSDLFLPFEGDQMLSVILSKAFMLAEDKKITDETIKRQIG